MDSTLLRETLNKLVKTTQEAEHGYLLAEEDLELKKFLVFDFVSSLLEDESLNLYKTQDVIMIALIFWKNGEEERQYSEQRIQDLLAEPVQQNHFIHFQKQFEKRDLAYEFILESIYLALSKNWILGYAYEEILKKARKEGSGPDLIELPMKKRESEALERVLVKK